MTIKFFSPTDPRLFDEQAELWIRDNLKVVAIEQLDNSPSAYFIYGWKDDKKAFANEFTFVVKHKNFFKEHFSNYNEANHVINQVKEKAYGR